MSHYSPIIALLVTVSLTAAILRSRFGSRVQDIPNERPLHVAPIPRIRVVGLAAGRWSAWFRPLVFSPFIVDASATLAKRALRGDKITEAHCEHYYPRAMMGFGHRSVALGLAHLRCGVDNKCCRGKHSLCGGALMWIPDARWKISIRG